MTQKIEIIKASCKGDKGFRVPNQDYVAIFENDKYLIATVSDGLGSSKYSLFGAKLACQITVDEIMKIGNSNQISQLSVEIPKAWEKNISNQSGNIKDYRTTSSFVTLLKQERKIAIGYIGDVFISVRIDETIHILNPREKDFLNETECLGSGSKENYTVSIFDFENGFDFLIASDGIGDELLDEKINDLHIYLKSKYEGIKAYKRNSILKKEISRSMNEKNNDDKSLVFVWIKNN